MDAAGQPSQIKPVTLLQRNVDVKRSQCQINACGVVFQEFNMICAETVHQTKHGRLLHQVRQPFMRPDLQARKVFLQIAGGADVIIMGMRQKEIVEWLVIAEDFPDVVAVAGPQKIHPRVYHQVLFRPPHQVNGIPGIRNGGDPFMDLTFGLPSHKESHRADGNL